MIFIMGQALGVGLRLLGFDRKVMFRQEFPYHDGQTIDLFFRPGHYEIFVK